MPAKYKGAKSVEPKVICKSIDCPKLGRYQPASNFYKTEGQANPYYPYCKTCIEKNIDVNNLNEVYDFLEQLNRPFIMDVWIEVCSNNSNKYIENYIKAINKAQYADLKWANSILEKSEVKPEEQKKEAQLSKIKQWNDTWQGEYTDEEIKYLDDYLEGLKRDFDISSINHLDYAREITKTSLLKNQAYNTMMRNPEEDNIKNYKMLVGMFDNLSKSAQFTESQRSANDVGLGSFGQIFDAVEKNNWVPPYTPDELDIYDKLLSQFSNIEKSL